MQECERILAPRRIYQPPKLVKRDRLALVSGDDAGVISIIGPIG
jgi:hypothetical protein